MKPKLPRIFKNIQKIKYKKCPVVGGWCFNPLCIIGCVED